MSVSVELVELRRQRQSSEPIAYARQCCVLAKRFEKAGKYDEAKEALSDFWAGSTERPTLEALDDATKAEVMMRIGALAGWLTSANQIENAFEFAKDLITQSIEMFERLGDVNKTAEARGDLALIYWREGAFDEARVHFNEALLNVGSDDPDLRAILLIRAGCVEVTARRLNEALRLFLEAAPLAEKSEDHAIKGALHIEFGLVYRRLAMPENREDYIDRALIEYAAASFHFEQAGNERALARVENNLGYLFVGVGRFKEAHAHLNRARDLFTRMRDYGTAAKVDDTRARAYLGEGRLNDAERMIRQAVRVLERGGEQAELADALTTCAVVTARMGRYGRARELLDRAIRIATTVGDLEGAGRAKLTIIEELAAQTSPHELVSEIEGASQLLEQSQDPNTVHRLIQCSLKVIRLITETKPTDPDLPDSSWEGFSIKRELRKIEKIIIERALRDAGGSVTKAAQLLGFRHHQSLITLINTRHRDLLGARSAVRKRRQHLISKPRRVKKETAKGNVAAAAAAAATEE